MVTATEYRDLALKFYRWAAEAETDEVRDTYLRLARGWTLAALGVNYLPLNRPGPLHDLFQHQHHPQNDRHVSRVYAARRSAACGSRTG
jgi:hypothetical protein